MISSASLRICFEEKALLSVRELKAASVLIALKKLVEEVIDACNHEEASFYLTIGSSKAGNFEI